MSSEERQTVTHEDTEVDSDLQRHGERNHRECRGTDGLERGQMLPFK